MKRPSAPAIAVIVLLTLPLLYPASYLALLNEPFNGEADYRFGGLFAERFFRPLENVDRWLRPKHWERVTIH
jgi:hypothetical protein